MEIYQYSHLVRINPNIGNARCEVGRKIIKRFPLEMVRENSGERSSVRRSGRQG